MQDPAQILVCDDDDMIVQIVTSKLKSLGYGVMTAGDGTTALAMIRKTIPSVLILDTIMPGVGGLEVLRAIRASRRTAALPVLMLTARRGEDDISAAVRLGANDYLGKPFSLGDLATRVERLLIRSEPQDQAWL